MIKEVRKRDGRVVTFNQKKISNAIYEAALACGGTDRGLATDIAKEVTKRLNVLYEDEILEIEQLQDEVEKVLIEKNHIKTAKSYILYRQNRNNVRELDALINKTSNMFGNYLQDNDWRIKENSNMQKSVNGLNNYIREAFTKNYWLHDIYPENVKQAHINGDIHMHDLGFFGPYCAGWDLKQLLTDGFGGVEGKVESKPAKHMRSFLNQVVNSTFTTQGETAGAQAWSSFDTYCAPFIRRDKMSFEEVKQCIQEFVFSINIPTRVGFQCLSEDTEILTRKGWKNHTQVSIGDVISTFNIETQEIEFLTVKSMFNREYKGEMYNLKNRVSDQLVSPQHNIIRKISRSNKYVIEKIEDVAKLETQIDVPIGSKGVDNTATYNSNVIELIAWIISEGNLDNSSRGSNRITISQSEIENKENYDEIINLCDQLKLSYKVRESHSPIGQPCKQIRFNAKSSRKIRTWFDINSDNVKHIPHWMFNINSTYANLFLQTYLKGDGKDGNRITTTSKEILDGLQHLAVLAGFGTSVATTEPIGISKKLQYHMRLLKSKNATITKIEKVDYDGIIWCPSTDNGTVIARRNGKVFITGNCPFSNVTLDIKVPKTLAEQPVVLGGEFLDSVYGDYQEEMDIFNCAFCEVMGEGDAKGRVFTFPIPTINITKEFEWDTPVVDAIMKMTCKYGIPYFANYINSDLSPDDAVSMCPLSGKEKVLVRNKKTGKLRYSSIKTVYYDEQKQLLKDNKEAFKIYSQGSFVDGHFNLWKNQQMMEMTLQNGHTITTSSHHLNFIKRRKDMKEEVLESSDLEVGMYLPYSLNPYKGLSGNPELGYLIGAYAGDGSFDRDNTVIYSLSTTKRKQESLDKIIGIVKKYFNATYSVFQKGQLITLQVHSKALCGLCRDFVSGIKRDKHYLANIIDTSVEFREAVIQGHKDTDGDGKGRISTSSIKMVEMLNMIATSLGTTTKITKDTRKGRLSNYPNYSVLIYNTNHDSYGTDWFKEDNKFWVRITSIENKGNQSAYCFEVKEGDPIFTVGTTGILTHNCRLRIDTKELKKRGGGLFGSNPLTGSIGVVTINLPRIGYLAKSKKDLLKRIKECAILSKISLEIKREIIEDQSDKELYPYSTHFLRGVKERTGQYWFNHFNTIGIIGMNEMLLNFNGSDMTTEEGNKLAVDVMSYLRNIMIDFQKETGHMYNLEATPAEGLSYRFAQNDIKKYPDIIQAGELEKYYTNSSQLPVGYTEDIMEMVNLQDKIQSLYTGGTVQHLYLGERVEDPEVAKSLIKKIFTMSTMPYISITPTFSVCKNHGYIAGEHFTCPKCGEETEVYSRVVGYLRPVKNFNKGKKEEYRERKVYKIKE